MQSQEEIQEEIQEEVQENNTGNAVDENQATANTANGTAANTSQPVVDTMTGQPFTPIASAQQSNNNISAGSFLFSGGSRRSYGRVGGDASSEEQQQLQQPPSAIYQSKNFKASLTKNQATAEQALHLLKKKYKLSNSPEVLAMAAQQAFGHYQFVDTLKYCQALLSPPPNNNNGNSNATAQHHHGHAHSNVLDGKAAFCYVSALSQLRQKRTLFRIGHEWVSSAPKEAKSWFAVGAYYYACQRAQRHFCRATRLDPQCVEAWIAFGASFAACDESDQALASFRAAQRIAPGHHVSLLYIGMEYLRTNHLVLAEHFLLAAHESCHGTDALAMSELGVLNMHQKKLDHAIAWFLQALGANADVLKESEKHHPTSLLDVDALESLVENVHDEYWEPTLYNLAHVYRKERFFDHAVVCLERCIALKESSSAYSALGYVLHLQAMTCTEKQDTNLLLQQAIDTYHQALAKKPDAAFCTEMLTKALGNALETTNFFVDDHYYNESGGNGSNSNKGGAGGLSINNMSHISKQSSSNASSFFSPPKDRAATAASGNANVTHRSNSNSNNGSRLEQSSSMMMEDGLSLSLESNSDVDMS
ncbi:MAG: hypothetical protein SGARI_001339 [Bacillariaceae sp.]